MSMLPCMNPNCKSNGRPHPNCRCHGGMAEGGEAKSHCSKQLEHLEGCEYKKEAKRCPSPSMCKGRCGLK